jgi:hypothetical protein
MPARETLDEPRSPLYWRDRCQRAERMLERIRTHGGGIWDGYDCATGATAVLDGEDAGHAHALARPVPEPQPAAARCTCGHEDSDGRGDVLACPVHGIGAKAESSSEHAARHCTCWGRVDLCAACAEQAI